MFVCKRSFDFYIFYLTHRNVVFDILEPHAFINIAYIVSLKNFIFAYFCNFANANVVFDILEPHAFINIPYIVSFKKLHICIFL